MTSGDRPSRQIETSVPGTPDAGSNARAFLRAALRTWQLDGFGEVTELLTDELVSNVVRHVGSPITLRAEVFPHSIRVEVEDTSRDTPVLRTPKPDSTGGRGILLVERLSDRWGVEVHHGGKTVWFELDVTTATEEVHDSD